jgi:nucleoside-diphosphate-sugar epimerase
MTAHDRAQELAAAAIDFPLSAAERQERALAIALAHDRGATWGEVAREFGLIPVPVPGGIVQSAAKAVRGLPTPPMLEWIEAISHPAVMDTSKAKEQLGWRPRYTAIEALRDTLRD